MPLSVIQQGRSIKFHPAGEPLSERDLAECLYYGLDLDEKEEAAEMAAAIFDKLHAA